MALLREVIWQLSEFLAVILGVVMGMILFRKLKN
jgi:hypothetical protein